MGVSDSSAAQSRKFGSSVMTPRTCELVVPEARAGDLAEKRKGMFVPREKRSLPGNKEQLALIKLSGIVDYLAVVKGLKQQDILGVLAASRSAYKIFVGMKSLPESERMQHTRRA